MMIQNKLTLRRFTYICLSLSSILLSRETQAGLYCSKPAVNEDETYHKWQRRQEVKKTKKEAIKPEKEVGDKNKKTVQPSTADIFHIAEEINKAMDGKNKIEGNYIKEDIEMGISLIPNMKEEQKKHITNIINKLLPNA